VGFIVPSCIVAQDDPEREEEFNTQVCLFEAESTERSATRQEKPQKKLAFGDHLTLQERQQVELLLAHTEVFALIDYELVETEVVTHNIRRYSSNLTT